MTFDEQAEALLMRAAAGDAAAASEFTKLLWPVWMQMVRATGAMRTFRDGDDHVHNVALRLLEKLGTASAHALTLYQPWRARHVDKTFSDWMRIVVANTARDYVRAQSGRVSESNPPQEISRKRLLNEFSLAPITETVGTRPPYTNLQTAKQLLEFATQHLEEDQLQALDLWISGADFDEIATELLIDTETARRLVRSAVAVMRRRFAG
jgi:DNA-directed RNA polymerase specialized sigma24 family protein